MFEMHREQPLPEEKREEDLEHEFQLYLSDFIQCVNKYGWKRTINALPDREFFQFLEFMNFFNNRD